MPISFQNRTIQNVVITQAAAGSTDLVAAPGAELRIYVVRMVFTMSLAGTVKFTEGTGPTDITGVMDIAQAGGMVVVGDGIEPVLFTPTANSKLSIVTTAGQAEGWLHYYVAR